MKVWAVFEDWGMEGEAITSLHATQEGAIARRAQLDASRACHHYIETFEVES